MIKKIAVIGPESTGKTTLCQSLAKHFNAPWVPEFARSSLDENGPEYDLADLTTIAHGQIRAEDEITRHFQDDDGSPLKPVSEPVIFFDTDLHVIKIWSEFVFNQCDNFILTQIARRQYDLYLLCVPDIAWVPDLLRDYPDLRRRLILFEMFKDAMINQETPWIEIRGDYEERLQLAVSKIGMMIG